MSIKSSDVDVLYILHQHCQQLDELKNKWALIEANKVLPPNSTVKENQLFGFAVVPQSDVDLGTSLEMPEYSFLNYLSNTEKLFKYADDCLDDALQEKKAAPHNLLLYKLDIAESAANNMLIVKPKNSLPCGMFLFNMTSSTGKVRQLENTTDLQTNLQTALVEGAPVKMELNDRHAYPDLDRVINIQPQDCITESLPSVSGDPEAWPSENTIENVSQAKTEVKRAIKKRTVAQADKKRKKAGDLNTSQDNGKTQKKKRTNPIEKLPEGMNSLGSDYTVKDMLEMGTGYPGWKRYGVSSIIDDDVRENSFKTLSERATDKDSETNQSKVSEDVLLADTIENRKQVPLISVHVSIDEMRYEKMGLPPPPPMPQSLIDRHNDSRRKGTRVFPRKTPDSANSSQKTQNMLSELQCKFKGENDGLTFLQETVQNEIKPSLEDDKKLMEIKRTLQRWKEKSTEGNLDQKTRNKILSVTRYVQETLQTKLVSKANKSADKDPCAKGSDFTVSNDMNHEYPNVKSEMPSTATNMKTETSSGFPEHIEKSHVQKNEIENLSGQSDITNGDSVFNVSKGNRLTTNKISSEEGLRMCMNDAKKLSSNGQIDQSLKHASKTEKEKKSRPTHTSLGSKDSLYNSSRKEGSTLVKSNKHRECSDRKERPIEGRSKKENTSQMHRSEKPNPLGGCNETDINKFSTCTNSVCAEDDVDAAALLEELYDSSMRNKDFIAEHKYVAEGGEADMSLDASFETDTSNIQLGPLNSAGFKMEVVDASSHNLPLCPSNHNPFERPPLPNEPPPKMTNEPPLPPSSGVTDLNSYPEHSLLLDVLKKTQSKEFQDRLKTAIGVVQSETVVHPNETASTMVSPPEVSFSGAKATLDFSTAQRQNAKGDGAPSKHSPSENKKVEARLPAGMHSQKKNANGGAKKTKQETAGQFHGRTLLMGREVPPRNIPLQPLYLKKPYTSSGSKQWRPKDPRPKYYSCGGLEKRIIKQMEDDAKKLIRDSLKKNREGEQCFKVDTNFNVSVVDVELVNPCADNTPVCSSRKQVLCSSQTLNTIGAELEKRINKQVNVAYRKLTSHRMTANTAVNNKESLLSQAGDDASSQSESVNDPWDNDNTDPLQDLPPIEEIFAHTNREQLRRETERKLQIVERKLDRIRSRSRSKSELEDGEVGVSDDDLTLQTAQIKSANSDPYANDAMQTSSDDIVDPWEEPFQGPRTPDSDVFDPWDTPASDAHRAVEDTQSRVLFSSYSSDRRTHGPSYVDNYEAEQISRGLSYSGQRSTSRSLERKIINHDDRQEIESSMPSFSRQKSRSPERSSRNDRHSHSPDRRHGSRRRSRSPYNVRSKSPDRGQYRGSELSYYEKSSGTSKSQDYRRTLDSNSRRRDCSASREDCDSRHRKSRREHDNRGRRAQRKFPSKSSSLDPGAEKDSVRGTNQSDTQVSFMGMTSAQKEYIPKLGERVVEKLPKMKSRREGNYSVFSEEKTRLVSKVKFTEEARVVVAGKTSTLLVDNSEIDNCRIFQKCENIQIQHDSSSPLIVDQDTEGGIDRNTHGLRQVVNFSSGTVATTADSTISETPGSRKKFTNKGVWNSGSEDGAEALRPSVFSRLGYKSFNTEKVPPMHRLQSIRNEAIYNDDTFGDLNTSMAVLEEF